MPSAWSGDPDGDRFVSPSTQRERISTVVGRDALTIVHTFGGSTAPSRDDRLPRASCADAC